MNTVLSQGNTRNNSSSTRHTSFDHHPVPTNRVQSNRHWYHDRKAEQSAGLVQKHPYDRFRKPWEDVKCQLCHIYIGPGYVEEALYFCHIQSAWTYDANDNYIYIHDIWCVTCRSCALRKPYDSFCACPAGTDQHTIFLASQDIHSIETYQVSVEQQQSVSA